MCVVGGCLHDCVNKYVRDRNVRGVVFDHGLCVEVAMRGSCSRWLWVYVYVFSMCKVP